MKADNDIFKKIADQYVEVYGEKAKRELAEIERENKITASPGLEKRVRAGISGRRRYAPWFGMLAACVLMLIALPRLIKLFDTPPMTSTGDQIADKTGSYELLSLSFEMPENFSVEKVEQDIEKTIYYLADSRLDDVVMTMEKVSESKEYGELRPLIINDTTVYGASRAEFKILKFEKDDVLYVLTCKHDINTLLELSENIV